MSAMTDRLARGRAMAWADLVPAFDHALGMARECEYLAAQAANLAMTHVDPAYPPLVTLLAQSVAE